jgi:hypothetical protein
MSVAGINPKLKLRKTISHPAEDVRVLGFEARNQKMGHDCVVLKAEELPAIRDGPGVTHWVVPTKYATGNDHIYILDEHHVYYARPAEFALGDAHTATKYGTNITGRRFPVDKMTKYSRPSVEIVN